MADLSSGQMCQRPASPPNGLPQFQKWHHLSLIPLGLEGFLVCNLYYLLFTADTLTIVEFIESKDQLK
jgi:hypothetical protein